ncbi:MAG: hypothetical protein QOJ32_288 [Frankiaceae bacterium]|nr:hypothetical protein [Frankiaceae bacterium]MDQ1650146.1 hypothetical protein [Frankiaceae bacterium]
MSEQLRAGTLTWRSDRRLVRRIVLLFVVLAALVVSAVQMPAQALEAKAPAVALLGAPDGNGYTVVSGAGRGYAYGSSLPSAARSPGTGASRADSSLPADIELSSPVVAAAGVPAQPGHWVVTRDGGVFGVDGARSYGSLAGRTPDSPVVGIVATSTGLGYWLVTAAGRVAGFGDAQEHGDLVGVLHSGGVVALAATPDGGGYWLATSTGAVFPFGNAAHLGTPDQTGVERGYVNPRPVVSLVASPTGLGYLAVADDGTTYAYGDLRDPGTLTGMQLTSPVVGAALAEAGAGVWLLQRNGGVIALRAPFYGAVTDEKNAHPTTVIAPYYAPAANGAPVPPTVDGAAGGLVAINCSGSSQGAIVVSALLARPTADVLTAGARDGVPLCATSSFRNSQQQVALRARYCTAAFDPAATCSRPVALPGRSMHEQGLAIDFASDAAGYAWLAGNAERFGLHHLTGAAGAVEPWHYSLDGS